MFKCRINADIACSRHCYETYLLTHVYCRNPGSNRGPSDLQSDALPTELSRPCFQFNTSTLYTHFYLQRTSEPWSRTSFVANVSAMRRKHGSFGLLCVCYYTFRVGLPKLLFCCQFFIFSSESNNNEKGLNCWMNVDVACSRPVPERGRGRQARGWGRGRVRRCPSRYQRVPSSMSGVASSSSGVPRSMSRVPSSRSAMPRSKPVCKNKLNTLIQPELNESHSVAHLCA